jgi:TPR repeat protein
MLIWYINKSKYNQNRIKMVRYIRNINNKDMYSNIEGSVTVNTYNSHGIRIYGTNTLENIDSNINDITATTETTETNATVNAAIINENGTPEVENVTNVANISNDELYDIFGSDTSDDENNIEEHVDIIMEISCELNDDTNNVSDEEYEEESEDDYEEDYEEESEEESDGIQDDINEANNISHNRIEQLNDYKNTAYKHQFIGLPQLAYKMSVCAMNMPIDIAEGLYLDAIDIDPYNPYVVNLAIIYETKKNNNELAKKYYMMGVEQGCALSMYNIADLYSTENNIELMVKYYEMANDYGDLEAYKRLIIHYYNTGDMCKFAKYYYSYLKDDVGSYSELVDPEYIEFTSNVNTLTILHKITKYTTENIKQIHSSNGEENAKHLENLIDYLSKTDEYNTYTNKIALFTKLNHIVECGICYDDDKININIHCGHTMCSDCYTRLYNKDCPFCRMTPP